MRCPRCQFENIPGQERCFKCSSVLEVDGNLDIYPPRMDSLERFSRRLGRSMRCLFLRPKADKPVKHEKGTGSADQAPLGGALASLLPGLGHYQRGRFRRIRYYWCAWLVLMLVSVGFYATPMAWFCFSFAAALHAWMALDVDLLDYVREIHSRFVMVVALTLVLFGVYLGVGRVGAAALNLHFQRSTMSIPGRSLGRGDQLLFRERRRGSTTELTRGRIVRYEARSIGRRENVIAIGQIVGLPGETVTIGSTVYQVQGKVLDAEQFPVPEWLSGKTSWTFNVQRHQYLVVGQFRRRGRAEQVLTQTNLNRVLLVEQHQVDAYAVRVLWPLQRRHDLD